LNFVTVKAVIFLHFYTSNHYDTLSEFLNRLVSYANYLDYLEICPEKDYSLE